MKFEKLKPLFICGHRKCGTTMLISLFDSCNEAIVYPDDSGIFYLYFPRYSGNKFSREEKLDRLTGYLIRKHLADILSRPVQSKKKSIELKKKCLDFYNDVNSFKKKKIEFKEILIHFIKCFAENFYPKRNNTKVWIEKTTSTEIYANELAEMFPNAKFIHLLRDPRDNWASLKSGWKKRYKDYNDDIRRLKQSMIERGRVSMELAKYNQELIGKKRYSVIRYEDITLNPEKEMRKLANFIGISFSEKLMSPSIVGLPWKGNNFSGKNFYKPSRDNVGRWKERIDQEEAMLMEYHFKGLMENFGYKPEFTLKEQQKAAAEHYKWFNFSTPYSAK